MISHENLINTILDTGLKAEKDGACAGFSQVVIEAYLGGELSWTALIETLNFLNNLPQDMKFLLRRLFNELNKQGNTNEPPGLTPLEKLVVKKHQSKQKLSADETVILKKMEKAQEIFALFQAILLYQKPNPEIFARPIIQTDVEELASVIQSKPIAQQKGLVAVDMCSRSQTIEEMEAEFAALHQYLQTHPTDLIFGLEQDDHRNVLIYSAKEQEWIMADINFGIQKISPDNIAKTIFECFQEENYCVFTKKVIATGDTADSVKKIWAGFKQTDEFKLADTAYKNKSVATRKNQRDFSLAHLAALEHQTELFSELLNIGIDLTEKNAAGFTVLENAMFSNDLKILQMIAEKNPQQFFAAQGKGKSALNWAARYGHIDVCQFLLDLPGYADKIDERSGEPVQTTALFAALSKKNYHLIDLLLDYGADPTIENSQGVSPLWYAIAMDVPFTVIRKLFNAVEEFQPQYTDSMEDTALHYVAKVDNPEAAEFIFQELKADSSLIDARNSAGYTPLDEAAITGNWKVFTLLLENGADPSKSNIVNILRYAIENKAPLNIKKLLLEIALSQQNFDMKAILHFAAKVGDERFAREILQQVSDPHILVNAEKFNEKPLNVAAKNGNWQFVKLLIEHNADPTIQDEESFFPIYHAIKNNAPDDVIQTLFEKMLEQNNLLDAKGRSPLDYAAEFNNNKISHLLQNLATPNKATKEKQKTNATAQLKFKMFAESKAHDDLLKQEEKKSKNINKSNKKLIRGRHD